MTIEALLQSNLLREFEKAARAARKEPADELAELMAEYIESETDGELFDSIQRESNPHGYTEDDAVGIVREARRKMQK